MSTTLENTTTSKDFVISQEFNVSSSLDQFSDYLVKA
jgi:hypothetical protein